MTFRCQITMESMMYGIMKFIMIFSIFINSFVISAPLDTFILCGKDLSDTLAEVCSGRGYNVAFDRGHSNGHRSRRGIVDECCRRFCTRTTLEAYCSPISSPSTPSDNFSVRKRNGFTEKVKIPDEKTQSHDVTETYLSEDVNEQTRHQKRKLFAHTDTDPHWQGTSRRFSTHSKGNLIHVLHGSYPNSKVKRNGPSPDGSPSFSSLNDFIETERYLAQLNDPHVARDRIRHPRTHSSRGFRLKDRSQIGTVSPYYLGRTLVFPTSRKNRLPHH